MKKILFAFMAVGLMASASSCNKCGYCNYPGGQSNTSAICQNGTLGPLGGDGYKEAKANCSANGGSWVITK